MAGIETWNERMKTKTEGGVYARTLISPSRRMRGHVVRDAIIFTGADADGNQKGRWEGGEMVVVERQLRGPQYSSGVTRHLFSVRDHMIVGSVGSDRSRSLARSWVHFVTDKTILLSGVGSNIIFAVCDPSLSYVLANTDNLLTRTVAWLRRLPALE